MASCSLISPQHLRTIRLIIQESSCCFASCSPTRANKGHFRRWQIPPAMQQDDYAVLYVGNTSFLWDTDAISETLK